MTEGSYIGQIPLSVIRVDEELWGPGAEPMVKAWLRDKYDPETMPALATATIDGREGYWLLGWEHQGTRFPPLLTVIFGEEYARRALGGQMQAMRLCPRCQTSYYTPYEEEMTRPELAPRPALSRTTRGVPEEDKIFVCTWCGTDEAMEEFQGKLTPVSEWPVRRPGAFGMGRGL